MQPFHAHLRPGELLHERYRIGRMLGAGGMSVVYLASDERLGGKQWAVKESKPVSQDVRQLIHEAKLLTALRHPHLPLIVDFFPPDEGGRAYLVMEYIEGETLAERLRRKSLSFQEIVAIAIPVCEALSYLHEQEPPIIFRDVKPSNIMITKQGQVKLIDFGIARNVNTANAHDTVKLGTIGFAAPEQYEGRQSDARTDLYGVGALLGHILTAGTWRGEQSLKKHMLQDDVPASFYSVMMKLLAKQPQDRYQKAAELLEELRQYIPVKKQEYPNQESASHMLRRGKSTVVIAFLGAAPGLGTTHASLMCAYQIGKRKLGKIAYVDADPASGTTINALAADCEGEYELTPIKEKTKLFGFHCYCWKDGEERLPALMGQFDYIVLDLGCYRSGERIDEFMRAQVPVLVGSQAPWRRMELDPIVSFFESKQFRHWYIANLFPCDGMSAKRSLKQYCRGEVSVPVRASPFAWDEQSSRWLDCILELEGEGANLLYRLSRWMGGRKFGKGGGRS
ncbi:serine/threonine protein kinase [Paenibacillus apiarius]|uniref:Serine/threonine protein kinase n=1 Tax=Paenibacillus apiarius TaxID=46240 RepID=A0ABT4DU03_9BACL|nr:serine/threonine-protein kinase [Paenibacillus apiarius]MCY9515922.1 serine/threonine protein kinase [Paenibacillus apiarius]MCY9520832.1 serine/threonine protein kinase [Paenibacillus apiarius]MCY9553537.1 serine/threonine protein kinase [Paenibacillus apiarius]MCY9557940.1 serine/threonine protein kinase [Paenibacillus apiarius]MCY9685795.1 serine/threonine protein kinase [Paenibacillus apiarius]